MRLAGPELLAQAGTVSVVDSADAAKVVIEHGAVIGVLVDAELPDMDAYDLCGWVRARFRDLPLLVLGDDGPKVDTDAVHLTPGGGVWTISESLRERMTDASVLYDVLETIPEPDYEGIASQIGATPGEVAQHFREILSKTGTRSHRELAFLTRNLPLNIGERENASDLVVRFEPGPIASA